MSLDDAIRRAPVKQRARVAESFSGSEIPLLRAFAHALVVANAREYATEAEIRTEMVRQHNAEMGEIAATLPPPGAPSQ
jgi:hypothetical protein